MMLGFSTMLLACADSDTPKPTAIEKRAAEKRMDSVSAQMQAAQAFQEKGDYPHALAIIDPMLQRYPGAIDALTMKAGILKAQNKAPEGLALLEKAHALQPRDKELAYDLVYEYADAKNAATLPLTDTLIKYDKTATVARAWYVKGLYYNNIGNEKEALRYYDSANISDFNFTDAYLDKGQLLFKQKKYEAALKTFALAQKVSPATAEFYFWVGKTQEAMGNKADAKTNYQRAFALDANMKEAKDAADKIAL